MYTLLEVYGPCISTASWTDWPRHRKVLATPFNENIMKFVWQESLKQAREMLEIWTQSSNAQEISTAKDTRTLSLNVLAATGFRKSYQFRGSGQAGNDEAGSYRDALQTVLDNRVGRAAADFKLYMENMLDEETSSLKEGKVGNGTLMTSFVRALGVNQKGQVNSSRQTTQSPPKGLTIDEIFGNIFVINFAGHDTTANTLAFSMILLAAYPEVQDWVAEELKEVIKDPKDDILEYEKVFEKLNRCRAVLLETLRQFPPIMVLPKWSNDKPQIIQVEGKTIVIPSQTGVTSSVLAIQMYPKYWKDPLRWDLSRWVTSTSNLSSQISQLYAEKVINPANSTFFSWSDGPQNCPGQKFSQVEFIAVLAILLRDHRVNIVQNDGESPEEAKE